MVPKQVIAGMYRDQVQVKNLRKYINKEWLAHVLAPQPHKITCVKFILITNVKKIIIFIKTVFILNFFTLTSLKILIFKDFLFIRRDLLNIIILRFKF